jgi:serine/threonine protein kinase
MAFCTTCGKALSEDDAFCPACGTSASLQPESPATAESPVQSAPATLTTADPESAGLRAGPYDDPDRYELLDMRTRGGEGELWRGALSIEGVPLPVAVKVINQSNAEHLDDWSKRWKQQTEILRTLDHPGLVKVREAFEGPLPHKPGAADPKSRSLYLVMNWVNGESLVEWVAHNRDRDLLDSVRVIARIAAAVDYLHSGTSTGRSVFHRDIKPANVLIDGASACLVDFGFARLMSDEPMTLAGTPFYLAPEIVRGAAFSAASDRFSLGATAYYAIVSEPPTPDDFGAMREKLTRARGVEGRKDLADHVLAMMHPEPAQRPANTVEWAQSLAAGAVSTALPSRTLAGTPVAAAAGAPTAPKRRGKLYVAIAAAVVVLALAAVGLAVAFGGKKDAPPASAKPPSPSASAVVSTSQSPVSSSQSASPSGEPSGSTPQPGTSSGEVLMNLAEYAQPLSGSVESGEATIKTKPYLFSIWVKPYSDNNTINVEYNVPSGFDHFQATIGLDDTSGSSATTTFQITNAITGEYLYGGAKHPVTLKVNQSRSVNIKLPTDILRIRLTTVSNASGNDWDVGVIPVWGDAQFTAPEGQAVLPSPVGE